MLGECPNILLPASAPRADALRTRSVRWAARAQPSRTEKTAAEGCFKAPCKRAIGRPARRAKGAAARTASAPAGRSSGADRRGRMVTFRTRDAKFSSTRPEVQFHASAYMFSANSHAASRIRAVGRAAQRNKGGGIGRRPMPGDIRGAACPAALSPPRNLSAPDFTPESQRPDQRRPEIFECKTVCAVSGCGPACTCRCSPARAWPLRPAVPWIGRPARA